MRAGLITRAHELSAGLVELHSHPNQRGACFSWSDLHGFDDFVPHVMWRLGGRPYVAVVMAVDSLDGVVWRTAGAEHEPLALVVTDRDVIRPTVCCAVGGSSCLVCMGELDPVEAGRDLERPEERENRRAIYGVTEDLLGARGPSVVSINGVVASHGARYGALNRLHIVHGQWFTTFGELHGAARSVPRSCIAQCSAGRKPQL